MAGMSSLLATPGNPVITLWPNGAPGALGTASTDIPSMTAYMPDPASATGTGVVICGGGGYDKIEVENESIPAAEFFTKMGVAAFVLRYRLTPAYQYPVMMWDAQRAIKYLRGNAAQYGLKPGQIGIMGFSAGGHLASAIAVHSGSDFGNSAADDLDKLSARPDLQILIYPVIMMSGDFVAKSSHHHLLGDPPDPKLEDYLSNEKHVTANAPRAFVVSTFADIVAPCENSLAYFSALRTAAVASELHIFQDGAHGAGLAPDDPSEGSWPGLLEKWLRENQLLGTKT
jgi:acetyl esterase/lipase